MMKFCKQCCELAKFIETKEYSGIIEYDKESQHLKYLYKNQKKKYKKYKQALKMTKANGLKSYWLTSLEIGLQTPNQNHVAALNLE